MNMHNDVTCHAHPAPSIFISYARKDAADLAQRLQSELTQRGLDAWLDTQRIAGGATWTRDIERALDHSTHVLVLLTQGSYTSEICRAEQLRALRKGKYVIPLKAQLGTDIPLHLEPKNYLDFTDPAHHAARFELLLTNISANTTVALPEQYRRTPLRYLTAPPRVANYLERPEVIVALRDTVFAEDDRQPIALTALAGMGGIGKTVLARALTEDQVVHDAFPDGIVWITAGRDRTRDFIQDMREVAKALGHDLTGMDTPEGCRNRYRTILSEKAALIIVDDVWSKSDIEPLLADSPRARLLFTTRDLSIGRFLAARHFQASLLEHAQCRRLLAQWANLSAERLPPAAEGILVECNRLPLALSVIGAMLRDTDTSYWADTLRLLQSADISAIEDQLPEGQQSFFRAVEVSLQSLKPALQQHYQALAVLLEDAPVHPVILQTLWNLPPDETARTAKQLIDRSLAQPGAHTGSLTLHDLQLDFIRARFRGRHALSLIHEAAHLSARVTTPYPQQFASQMVGRLLAHQHLPEIVEFTNRIAQETPKAWLRPLFPSIASPGTALLRTLAGHEESVLSVSLSADGRIALSASSDQTLRVWHVETGLEVHMLATQTGRIWGVSLSADGRVAISASDGGMLKVWDVEAGREIRTFAGHAGSAFGVSLSADGTRAVSASRDGTLKVWDMETGVELHTLAGHTDWVLGVSLSADGTRAVSASEDGTLKVWDLESGVAIRTLTGHTGGVSGVSLSADGTRAVSASEDGTLKVWILESGVAIRTLTGHAGRAFGVSISADGTRAVSAAEDGTLKVWDLDSGVAFRTLTGHANWVLGVSLSTDGRRAVSASRDGTLKVWNLEGGVAPRSFAYHSGAVRGVSLSADQHRAISASADGTLKVWDVERGQELRTLWGHRGPVYDVSLSADGRRAISASADRTLKVWDVESGVALSTLAGHADRVRGVSMSADGRRAVSASDDRTLKVWDVESGLELRTLKMHVGFVLSVSVSADGRLAVSASYDRTLKVWDVESGVELRTLTGHTDAVYGVSLSTDGRLAISASYDRTLKVWDVNSGAELRTLAGHTGGLYGVSLNTDDSRAVSASEDRMVSIWDVSNGKVLATFTCDHNSYCCSMRNDLIAIGDAGGTVHFLRLQNSIVGDGLGTALT